VNASLIRSVSADNLGYDASSSEGILRVSKAGGKIGDSGTIVVMTL